MNLEYFKSNIKIFSLLIICLAITLPAFSESDFTKNEIHKSIIENNMNKLSTDYISEVEKMVYMQMDMQQYEDALKTANYLIKASKKYYGENHSRVGFAYLARARYYLEVRIPDLAKEDLYRVYEIYTQNKDDEDLKNNILNAFINYNLCFEESYEALKYHYQLVGNKYNNANEYLTLSQIYTIMQNHIDSKTALDRYYQKIKDNDHNQNLKLFYYHMSKAILYQAGQKMDLLKKELDEAEKLIDSLEKYKTEARISFNVNKIQYFIDMKQFDEALSLLDKNNEFITENGHKYEIQNSFQQYLDYYLELTDSDNFNKYAKKLDKYYETLPTGSLSFLPVAEKQINLYKNLNMYRKANEHAKNVLNQLEPVKNYIPYQYGKFSRLAAEVKIQEGNISAAKIYLDKALKSYELFYPSTAYVYYEIYKDLGEISNIEGNTKEAFQYYKKAEVIIKKLQGDKANALMEIYYNLANTYLNLGDKKNAVLYAEKSLAIRKHNYGKIKNSINQLNSEFSMYHIYKESGLNKKASEILDRINSIVEKNEVIGNNKSFYYYLYLTNADVAMQNGQYEAAINYVRKAMKNSINKQTKIETYKYLYEIYSQTNNKIKAFKYKKLGQIE